MPKENRVADGAALACLVAELGNSSKNRRVFASQVKPRAFQLQIKN
jgi:hypothetical protein